ncbi:MAG: FAD-dependent oxidoreductase [Rhodococcus sp. (in: high G+C Gram-positive bacteria)]
MSRNPQVLVVGGGGSGLVTALELAARGVDVRIIDKAEGPCTESRGTGLQARTLELLEMHDVTDTLLAVGNEILALTMFLDQQRVMEVDFRLAPSKYPSVALPQCDTEAALRARLAEHSVEVEWSTAVTGFEQDGDGVTVAVTDRDGVASTVRAEWLVGADGAGSTIRDRLGMTFAGASYTERWGLMDVNLQWDLSPDRVRVFRTSEGEGQYIVVPLGGNRYRVQTDQMDPGAFTTPTVTQMQTLFDRYTGHTGVLSDPTWRSAFRVHRRQVVAYRDRRVFLAGDSAHIHTPAGGQGLNTGIQDGINLGWKLAHVAGRQSGAALLDTYEEERHPIAAEVLRLTETLARQPHRLGSFAPADMARTANVVSQCAITYRDGPLAQHSSPGERSGLQSGDRLPDVRIGERRLHELLRERRVLVVVVGPTADTSDWDDRFDVQVVAAHPGTPGGDELVSALGLENGVVVIRPDGYLGALVPGDIESSLATATAYLKDVLHMNPVSAHV